MRTPELEDDQRIALLRHGYDPDLLPRGVSGGPERVRVSYAVAPAVGWAGWPYLRNHICELDGVEIDGHEFTDLEPVDYDSACLHCGREWGDISRSD